MKVAVDKDKQLIVNIKRMDLAKQSADARPEVFSNDNALDAKIDSLHHVNDNLTLHIDSLNFEISALDVQIGRQDEEIDRIREEANEKTAAVDDFTVSELSEFFTNRYTAPGGQLGSDSTGTDSTGGN